METIEESDFEAEAMWLCRENYHNEMLKRTRESSKTYPRNETLKLLVAVGYALTGKIEDSVQQVSQLVAERSENSILAALVVQSIALRFGGTLDRTNLTGIESKIREERRRASATALSRAANVLFLLKKLDKAKEYAEKALQVVDQNAEKDVPSIVAAWIHLYISMANPNERQQSLERASELLKTVSNDAEFNFLLASAKLEELSDRHEEAIKLLSALVVRYPKMSLPLIEKMHNKLALKDWEEAIDTANRILSIEQNSIDSMKAKAIVAICRDGDFSTGFKYMQALFRNLIIAEPTNIDLILDNVQLFSRITNRDVNVISELSRITEKLIEQNANKTPRPMIELGNLHVLAGKIQDAENWYKRAVRIDESSFTALMGLANCQVLDKSSNSLDLAHQQIDFLMELETSNSIDPNILFMSAKLVANEPIKALDHLTRCVTTIIDATSLSKTAYYRYLNDLNPLFCLDVICEYLIHCPFRNFDVSSIDDIAFDNETMEKENDNGNARDKMCAVLEKIVEACPGMGVALLMLAKVRIQGGHLEEALFVLKKLLDSVDQSSTAAHLLTAQIYAHQGQYDLAEQSLELGLSFDFRVRDDPIYHLISSIIDREKDQTDSRIASLRLAISLVDASLVENRSGGGNSLQSAPISTSDKATLYLELVSACARIGNFDEAKSLMQQAKHLFGHSLEEARVLIANAELFLALGDIDEAIKCLMIVVPEMPYYLEAHTKLARIYLENRKDRQAFAKCFRELVEHCPGPRTYGMLGDAYIAIQEPDRAIEAYEKSLAKNPTDRKLAERMGKALVKTHQYGKAIGYYREIVKHKSCNDLKLDLAELYMKVKQFDKAENVLVQDLQDSRGASDLQTLEKRVCRLMLLGKIRERAGNVQSALTTLKEAKDNQVRCIQRVPIGTSNLAQKQILADICLDMADHASSLRDYHQAIDRYKEALSYKSGDVKALLSLAKLYMQVNDLDSCGQSCMALLNADPENEAASVMMADLAFRKVDFETAAFHFRQLLLRRPTYWTALARLIEVSRRTGNMSDLDEWLNRAAAASDGSNREAGYHYCSGLLDWRTGKLNSALRNFNCARRDAEWGQQAIYNMIEICLDPDDDSALSSEAFNDDDMEYRDSRSMALKTAQRLLMELSPKGNAHEMLTHRLLGDFFLLATKQKSNIEKALQDCTSLASQESLRDHVGPALGLAMAHILMKQTPRARNHLKRVCKNVWTFEDAEYLERCWLLLADIYVQSSKYELANDLLKRVLQHNATCVRAHELSGHISEREQNYREAAFRYGQAWKYGGKTKLSVGYKLAYCSSKCKSYADAIKVCNQVLRLNPDFPRIKKDILEKSMNNIRS